MCSFQSSVCNVPSSSLNRSVDVSVLVGDVDVDNDGGESCSRFKLDEFKIDDDD